MKNASQPFIVNTLKKDNGQRKIKKVAQTFADAVNEMDDPRKRTDSIWYPLDEIRFTALAAVICGSESYYDFETFGKAPLK